MLLIVAFAVGFGIGWYRAARRDGTLPDKVQYGFAHAVPLTLVTLGLMILAARMGWIAAG